MTSDSIPLVRRGRRNARYTTICNEIIDHPTLSPDARIALIYLLSKPDDWQLQVGDLRRLLGTGDKLCGRNKAYEVVRELKATAYVVPFEELRGGRYHRLTYYVFDEPHEDPEGFKAELRQAYAQNGPSACEEPPALQGPIPLPEIRETVGPEAQSPCPGIGETVASPRPEKPHPEKGDSTKEGLGPKTENPLPSPKAASRGDVVGEGIAARFAELWNCWPLTKRPNNRIHARRLFEELSPRNQHLAVIHAQAYRMMQKRRGGFEVMIPYLRRELFLEFDGAPQIDRDGYFVITADREEWPAWLAHYRGVYSPPVIASSEKRGYVLTHTRWPQAGSGRRAVEEYEPLPLQQVEPYVAAREPERPTDLGPTGPSRPELPLPCDTRNGRRLEPPTAAAAAGAKLELPSLDRLKPRRPRELDAKEQSHGRAGARSERDCLCDAADTTPAGGADKPLKRPRK